MSDKVCLNATFIEDDNIEDLLNQEYAKDYDKDKADIFNIDLDTPMHFTNEQKAWVKKYISINGERQRIDGARDFANKLIDKCKENCESKDLALECKKCMIWRREEILETLTEWQKGVG